MDDLNDLIWQSGPTKSNGTSMDNSVKAASSTRVNANSTRSGGDLLDLASPTLLKASHKLNELDPLQDDETSSAPRPSVASMRNLWEQIGNNNNNSSSNNNSSNGYNKYQSTINATTSNRSSSPLPAPHASKPGVASNSSSNNNSGHDPFGDLLGLGGAPHLGRVPSPSTDKKAPSLNDLSRTGSPASIPANSKPSTPIPADPWNLDLLNSTTGGFSTANHSSKESSSVPQKPPRGHRTKESHTSAGSPPVSSSSSSRRSPVINATVIVTEDDDNPLGILAEPVATKKAAPPPPPPLSNKPKVSHHSPSSPSTRSSQSPVIEGKPPRPPRSTATDDGVKKDHDIAQIVEMGFTTEQARTALGMSNGDVEAAVAILVQDREAAQQLSGDQVDNGRASTRPTRPARPNVNRSNSGRATGSINDEHRAPSDAMNASGINSERLWTAAEEIKQSVFSKASSLFQQSKTLLQERMDAYQQSASGSHPLGNSRHSTRLSLDGDESDEDDEDEKEDNTTTTATTSNSNNNNRATAYSDQYYGRSQSSKPARSTESQKPYFRPYRDTPEKTSTKKEASISSSSSSTPTTTTTTTTATSNTTTDNNNYRQQQRTPTSVHTHQSPPVSSASSPDSTVTAALKRAEELRQQGNERFKAGHYMDAEKLYTQAIDCLPSDHARNILLYNNRAMTRLKNANYQSAIDDCGIVITMIGGETGTTKDGVVFKDQLCKGLLRRATAYQTLELYDEAIRDYERASSHGAGVAATEGARQCRQNKASANANPPSSTSSTTFSASSSSFTNSPLFNTTTSTASASFPQPSTNMPTSSNPPSNPPPPTRTAFEDDWFSMGSGTSSTSTFSTTSTTPNAFARDWFAFENNASFNTTTATSNGFNMSTDHHNHHNTTTAADREHIEKSTAVAEMRRKEMQAKMEEQKRMAIKDQVEARMNRWRFQKEDNLRALLCSLDSILWPEAGVKQCGLQDLISPSQVKVRYMRAIARLHPDKVAKDATTEQQIVAQEVFVSLNRAWDTFRTQNNM
ncbi:hypothetical protein BDF22DRAFT_731439 [Syncephalis plumigaleata]|nr:hypothetical protein BDF22DRAFT_731439 [Syncephalis plumigaleata]